MGITKKQRYELWRNVPYHLTKEEAMELCKVINELYNKVYKISYKKAVTLTGKELSWEDDAVMLEK